MHLPLRTALVWTTAASLLAACAGPPGPAGQDAQPCTVTDHGDGSATIACPGSAPVTIRSGTNGAPGADGTDGTNGAPGGTGPTGPAGTSCSVSVVDAGLKVIRCSDGTVVPVVDGVDTSVVLDFPLLSAKELADLDLRVLVQSVSSAARPVVSFRVLDQKGRGVRNIPPANFSGLAILQLVRGTATVLDAGNGLSNDTWVSHLSNCTTCSATTESANATSLLDLGNGNYQYTFTKDIVSPIVFDGGVTRAGVAYDANAPHRFGLRLAASGNPFRPVDAVYDYVPANGADVTGQYDKVKTSTCLVCHGQWRAQANNVGGLTPFHNGQRYEVQYCVVCHNDQRRWSGSNVAGNPERPEPSIDGNGVMTPDAGTTVAVLRGEAVIHLPVFIHKIHMGKELTLKGPYAGMGTEMNEIAYPQSPANCTSCHRDALQADNWKTKPSRRACGGCHDAVDWVSGAGHAASVQLDDRICAACHPATGPRTQVSAPIATVHVPVAPPDPKSVKDGGTSSNTNASWLGTPTNPPAGAAVLSYAMPANAVTVVDAGVALNAQVKFKLVQGTTSLRFNPYDGGAAAELLNDFVGSPSVYCAWAVPQDRIPTPADFNASTSVYVKTAWRGASGHSMTGPDGTGHYTVTVGTPIPFDATLLTCGLGYTYNLSSTPPLTQTNVPGFPYAPAQDGGYGQGGLTLPPANVWQVAVGYAGRRGATNTSATTGRIVSAAKCNACHAFLGVAPTFHGGQRNDGPSCAFCHTPNRTSSGWSAGAASFVHAIHGGTKRTVPFNWHAISEDEGFYDVAFPGRPNFCETCHNPGYFDFSASWYTAANEDTRLYQTVGVGKYNGLATLADGGVNTNLWALSPYILPYADNSTDLGKGFSTWTDGGVPQATDAAGTTLVISPITHACTGCHDAERAILHMTSNGGSFYEPRGTALARKEQCLVCHGPGKVAAVRAVHYE